MERSNIGNILVLYSSIFQTNISVIDVKLPTEMELRQTDDIEFSGTTTLISASLNNKAQISIPSSIILTQIQNGGMHMLYKCSST